MIDRSAIAPLLLQWWDAGHAELPWRLNRDPYGIWIAEIMLQQTQIRTVIPYYQRWMKRFPTVQALAEASLDDVLKLWEGLGYYSRARNLHAAAKAVMEAHQGQLPRSVAELMTLKGIGRYTAGAIASIAFDQPAPILDGNVIRVLARLTDLADDVTLTNTRKALWQLAAELVPAERPGDFNQALMELGQQLCRPARPHCLLCPLTTICLGRQKGSALERPVRPPRKHIPHYDVAAGIIWQNQSMDSRFLIAQRPLDGLLGGLWEFPGGKREKGESLPQALQREIQEELDIEIKVDRPLARIKHAYTHFRITLHAYHAIHLNGDPQHIGVANHAWVTMADLDDYAFAKTDLQVIAHLREELGGGI